MTFDKYLIFSLRLALGWIFFYGGITKVFNPDWSAAGYLNNANTFSSFYTWLASPDIIPIVNFLNIWGLTLIGLSLLVGLLVRFSSIAGIVMMLFYYFPILQFPYVGANSFIINEHVIYLIALLLLFSLHAGRIWGLDKYVNLKLINRRY